MYTTACESCRKSRLKCIRDARGQDAHEICERCKVTGRICETKRRHVGRQVGVKNKRRLPHGSSFSVETFRPVDIPQPDDPDVLPSPLHFLASTATQRQRSLDPEDLPSSTTQSYPFRDAQSVLHKYLEWTGKIDPHGGFDDLNTRIENLLAGAQPNVDVDEASVFTGRIDMARPDALPEHDVISLLIVPLDEAQRLFQLFMETVTNGSMHFDPQLHTLSFVRSRSSFLLAVILAMASGFTTLCSNRQMHLSLRAHAARLEANVRINHLKSIEIVQAFLCLATWTEVSTTLCRDQNWSYISHAIALAIELKLDLPLPYCVLSDPMYDQSVHDIMVRNAHRVCLLLYIHDRNMAMTAGRYPILPADTSVFASSTLLRWGKHSNASYWDGPLCASVSLRKLVTNLVIRLGSFKAADLAPTLSSIEASMSVWRKEWSAETQSTKEYDIISRFSHFVLALTVMRKVGSHPTAKAEASKACDLLAFEVCCSSINHYRTWNGLLNSATFDTSMIAFCAIYIIQSISRSSSSGLSDWSLFQLGTIEILIEELQIQAKARHQGEDPGRMSVVDAMSRQLSRRLNTLLAEARPMDTSSPVTLETAYHRCVADLGLEDTDESAKAFGNSIGSWPSFQDSAEALGKLQRLGLKLIILSNVDNKSFSSSRKMLETGGGTFDAVYTAENIGSYKPDLQNFYYAFEHLDKDFGIKKEEVLSVANSKFHDVQPAHQVGIKCAWINRPKAIMGVKGLGEEPDFEFPSMKAFADAMEEIKA
ncbi:hypothetical protein P7C73_g1146, partial [Tremellales sp. Uapishka_1]